MAALAKKWRTRLEVHTLRKKLGTGAFELLFALTRLALRSGSCWPSYAWLQKRVRVCGRPLSGAQVKRALARLRAAGLVRDTDARRMRYGGAWKSSWLREVRCWIEPHKLTAFGSVETLRWLERAPGWGGKRKGAGRKLANGSSRTYLPKPADEVSRTCAPNQVAPTDNQVAPYISPQKERAEDSFIKIKESRCAQPEIFLKTRTGPDAITGTTTTPVVSSPPPVTRTPEAVAGARTSNGGPARRDPPPMPITARLPPAKTPSAPWFPPGLSEEDRVDWLLRAYRGMSAFTTGKRSFVLSRRDSARKSKYWAALLQSADYMLEWGWSPARWVAFSFDTWQYDRGKDSVPPLSYVFSEKRMCEQMEWFSGEQEYYCSSNLLVFSPVHKDLIARWSSMNACITLARGDDEQVQAAIERFFPGDAFERMCVQARSDAEAKQAELDAACARGEWLW